MVLFVLLASVYHNAAMVSTELSCPCCLKAGDIVPLLIDRVPGCRLGFGHAELSEIVWMRDAPSFFTAGMGADNYATSMKAVTNRVVDSWLSRPDVQVGVLSVTPFLCVFLCFSSSLHILFISSHSLLLTYLFSRVTS